MQVWPDWVCCRTGLDASKSYRQNMDSQSSHKTAFQGNSWWLSADEWLRCCSSNASRFPYETSSALPLSTLDSAWPACAEFIRSKLFDEGITVPHYWRLVLWFRLLRRLREAVPHVQAAIESAEGVQDNSSCTDSETDSGDSHHLEALYTQRAELEQLLLDCISTCLVQSASLASAPGSLDLLQTGMKLLAEAFTCISAAADLDLLPEGLPAPLALAVQLAEGLLTCHVPLGWLQSQEHPPLTPPSDGALAQEHPPLTPPSDGALAQEHPPLIQSVCHAGAGAGAAAGRDERCQATPPSWAVVPPSCRRQALQQLVLTCTGPLAAQVLLRRASLMAWRGVAAVLAVGASSPPCHRKAVARCALRLLGEHRRHESRAWAWAGPDAALCLDDTAWHCIGQHDGTLWKLVQSAADAHAAAMEILRGRVTGKGGAAAPMVVIGGGIGVPRVQLDALDVLCVYVVRCSAPWLVIQCVARVLGWGVVLACAVDDTAEGVCALQHLLLGLRAVPVDACNKASLQDLLSQIRDKQGGEGGAASSSSPHAARRLAAIERRAQAALDSMGVQRKLS